MPNPCNDLGQLGSLLGLSSSDRIQDGAVNAVSSADRSGSLFVCVDLEAFEFDHTKILEVGVATLDSRDLRDLTTDDLVTTWLSKIKSEHYIVQERQHLVNKRYVKGCPEGFIFGQSKIIPVVKAQALLRQHLSDPRSLLSSDETVGDAEAPSVYIVAHGLKNDTTLMKNFGIANVYNLGLTGDIDTQRICSGKKKPAGLKKLLDAIDIPYEHLHNGGNDCTYTLQALVKMIHMHHYEREDLEKRLELLRHPPEEPKKKKQRRGPKGEGERSVTNVMRPTITNENAV
ncbi:hypothetical protein KVT40_002485 [Elsinoe batatas]|uniref:Gfd2/YDR514C-like C-terminal domain-containing protein n=1 Tax=Elsinoe batatas TaxID=2601811 RepID=A0A8K0PDZ2_9PEZI|nr:hypothetical protein KVT40_002485 [Elsinoe batatas]